MANFKAYLHTLLKNQDILRVREAKYAGNAPLDLLNQIRDHEQAIALTKQVIGGQISETEWRRILKPFLVQQPPDSPHPPSRLGTPFYRIPRLPDHFVPRLDLTGPLKTQLLDGKSSHVSAIHGLGGIGKSTLAADLANDPDVKSHFKDGILWVTLGQQPSLLTKLNGWIQEALGDYGFPPTTVEMATARLHTLLQDKAVLLVVDDVWEPEQAKLFKEISSSNGHLLITTREAIVAKAVDVRPYPVDVMSPEQAEALLSSYLKRELTREEQQQAMEVAKAVAYLPLALELVGVQIVDGISWAELLKGLQAEIDRLAVLEMPGADEVTDEAIRKRLSLRATFYLSLRRLPADKRKNFIWLGVLPEDVSLNAKMAATLWQTTPWQAKNTLRYLRDKAILMPGLSPPDGPLSYRLHDLLHDVARSLLQAPRTPAQTDDLPGLGLALPEAHAALLGWYKKLTTDKLWHTLPDDGYIHAYLTWHMEQAGQVEEIHALLREETAEGRNGWYEACEGIGQSSGFLANVDFAWTLAETELLSKNWPHTIGLQCRYAMMIATFNSLSKNLPVELLVSLVEKKIWSPKQGLIYAWQKPDLWSRIEALTNLAPFLSNGLREIALEEAIVTYSLTQEEDYNKSTANSIEEMEANDIKEQKASLAFARQLARYRYDAEVLIELTLEETSWSGDYRSAVISTDLPNALSTYYPEEEY